MALLTDFNVRTEPALPAMGAAGSKIVDPVFGTTILRVTDATSAAGGAGVLYSTYPSVNLNSTRVMGRLNSNSNSAFWVLNPATFTVSARTTYSGTPNVLTYYMVWSGVNPDVVWSAGHPGNGTTAARLYTYNVATNTSTLIKDFGPTGANLTAAGLAPGTYYLNQMSMSKNDDVFAFTVISVGGASNGSLVWKRSTDTVLLNITSGSGVIDEVYIDKSGRYFYSNSSSNQALVYDLQAGNALVWTSQWAHNGVGVGYTFSDNSPNCLAIKNFVTRSATTMMCGYFGFSNNQNHHESNNTTAETYGLISRFNQVGGGVVNAFDNELVLVKLTGGNAVQRVCHHRSISNTYIASPFANISPDGQFVAFTSTWGTNLSAGGRIDLYLAQIPVTGTDTTPPAAPTGLTIS